MAAVSVPRTLLFKLVRTSFKQNDSVAGLLSLAWCVKHALILFVSVFIDTTPGKHGIYFFEGVIIQARLVDCEDAFADIAVGSFSLQQDETFLGLMNCNHQNGVNFVV